MTATFHNHSKWSEDDRHLLRSTLMRNRSALRFLVSPITFAFIQTFLLQLGSLNPDQTGDYLSEVLSYRDRGNIEIQVGLEFDWFEDRREVIAPFVARIPLDYRIGAIHHVQMQQFDMDRSFWTSKSAEEQDDVYIRYWGLVREMVESSLFDIAAHLDLPRSSDSTQTPI